MLPTDGDYKVRVYLMRNAARRNEVSDYTLTISVTGKPLAPIPASQDALLPGTKFHASGSVTCVPAVWRRKAAAVRGVRHPPRHGRHGHGRNPVEGHQAAHSLRRGQAGGIGFRPRR